MSGTLKVSGVVVKQTGTGESDKIITVLTGELGVIKIYVKGGMRLKNKFHAATGMFTYSDFVIFESRTSELYSLNEASVKHIFHSLSDNVEFLALAMYMGELVCTVTVPDDMNNEILRLFLNVLYMLCRGKWDVKVCKAAFELRFLSDVGFRPNFAYCRRCYRYKSKVFYFDAENGEIICYHCFKPYDMDYILIEMPAVMARRYIVYADLEQMFTFNLAEVYREQLCRVCEAHVRQHVSEELKTLEFLDNMIFGRLLV